MHEWRAFSFRTARGTKPPSTPFAEPLLKPRYVPFSRPLTIRDQYTNCATTQHPKQDHHLESPRARPEPFQACPSARRNRLSKNRKRNNSAAMLYPALECFCTVVGSSSSSSCFSQQKHRKPAREYTALWSQKRQEWQHHPPPRPVSRHRKFQNCQHHRKEAKQPEPHGLNRMFLFAAHAASRS